MRKLKNILSPEYVNASYKAFKTSCKASYNTFYDKNLATKAKRRVFGLKVGSIVAPAAFGIGVMAAVKAATIGIATTLAGASTAFTLGAVTAAGAPVAAILIVMTVAMGLTSGVLRNLLDRNVLAKAGNPVPKYWSRENGKAFFSKGNLLTMGLSAAGTLIGGLFIVDFAPQAPSAGPAQAFNSMATQPITEVAPAIEPSTAVAADALKADPLTASPAPDVLSRMFERNPLGEFFGTGPSTALDPLTASAVTPTADVVGPTLEPAASVLDAPVALEATADSTGNAAADAQYVDPADAVVAALDKGTTPPTLVSSDVPVEAPAAADVAPSQPATVPNQVVLPDVPAADNPAVGEAATPPTTAADAAPASAAPPATVEPKAYEGQKVGECTVKEVLTGWFNDSSYPPTNPTSVFDMECKVAPSAQTGDYIVLNGVADYGQKFGTMLSMEWTRVRDLVGQAELWIAPQMENRLNDHLYGGLGNVQVNASIKPLPL